MQRNGIGGGWPSQRIDDTAIQTLGTGMTDRTRVSAARTLQVFLPSRER